MIQVYCTFVIFKFDSGSLHFCYFLFWFRFTALFLLLNLIQANCIFVIFKFDSSKLHVCYFKIWFRFTALLLFLTLIQVHFTFVIFNFDSSKLLQKLMTHFSESSKWLRYVCVWNWTDWWLSWLLNRPLTLTASQRCSPGTTQCQDNAEIYSTNSQHLNDFQKQNDIPQLLGPPISGMLCHTNDV